MKKTRYTEEKIALRLTGRNRSPCRGNLQENGGFEATLYNIWRRHSACGGLSPEQFENQTLISRVSIVRG